MPWTLLNITKLVLSLTLVLLPISDLLYLVYVYQGGGVVAQVENIIPPKKQHLNIRCTLLQT